MRIIRLVRTILCHRATAVVVDGGERGSRQHRVSEYLSVLALHLCQAMLFLRPLRKYSLLL